MRALFLAGTAMFLASLGAAQTDTPPSVSLKLATTSARSGQAINGTVTVEFASGLHGYQNPPAQDYQIPLSLKAGAGVTLVAATYPKGQPMRMAGEDKDSLVYAGEITIPVVLKVVGAGNTTVNIAVAYQQCTDKSCYPPGSATARASLQLPIRTPVPKPIQEVVIVSTSSPKTHVKAMTHKATKERRRRHRVIKHHRIRKHAKRHS